MKKCVRRITHPNSVKEKAWARYQQPLMAFKSIEQFRAFVAVVSMKHLDLSDGI